jgi:hypothetical protein
VQDGGKDDSEEDEEEEGDEEEDEEDDDEEEGDEEEGDEEDPKGKNATAAEKGKAPATGLSNVHLFDADLLARCQRETKRGEGRSYI